MFTQNKIRSPVNNRCVSGRETIEKIEVRSEHFCFSASQLILTETVNTFTVQYSSLSSLSADVSPYSLPNLILSLTHLLF